MTPVWAVLQSFRLRDAIDIVLVAAVLYRVFVMFKGTRAIQMLLGLGGLMVASFLARRLELFSTSWILENFWSFWVLALIVLFQPELRRALAQIGQSRLFQGMTRAGARGAGPRHRRGGQGGRGAGRPSGSGRSSCWSARRGCATTPSSACRWTPWSRPISS